MTSNDIRGTAEFASRPIGKRDPQAAGAVIAAPPERVYELINDLQAFNRWNPFARQDPGLARRYESIRSGKGAA